MSLWDLIEAKQRRTATWPLLVGDPSAAAAKVEEARRTLALHEATLDQKKQQGKKPTAADKKRSDTLRADLKAAAEGFTSTVVKVELQSLPDDEWEALFADLEADDNGDLDIRPIHALCLAGMCVDPELRDAERWAEQFKKPTWTDGDRAALSRLILELNSTAPRFDAVGKG